MRIFILIWLSLNAPAFADETRVFQCMEQAPKILY